MIKDFGKRITLINKKESTIMRTTRVHADELLATGDYATTTKGKLKSFLNKERKMHRNKRSVQKYKARDGKNKNPIFLQDPDNGKTFVNIPAYNAKYGETQRLVMGYPF